MRRSIPKTERSVQYRQPCSTAKPLKLPVTSTVPMVPGGRVPAVKISLKPGDAIAPQWPFSNLIDHADSGSLPGASFHSQAATK